MLVMIKKILHILVFLCLASPTFSSDTPDGFLKKSVEEVSALVSKRRVILNDTKCKIHPSPADDSTPTLRAQNHTTHIHRRQNNLNSK